MKLQSPTKFAGTNWLISQSKYDSRIHMPFSDLGIKVANVLGQVFQGIYHISDDIYPFIPEWGDEQMISVRLHSCLSTFDNPQLTLLYLCCKAAKINVYIRGRANGCLLLAFSDRELRQVSAYEASAISVSTFMAKHQLFPPPKKIRWVYWTADATKEINNIGFSIDNFTIANLYELVIAAHQSCIRLQIKGLSPSSVEMQLSSRRRTGSTFEKHPAWEEHQSILRPYWDVDYMSKN
ncbi:MAG: hypothetical protein AAF810_01445 [Cyanobacteria bacterium P01_D01_bin.36]